MAVVQLEPLDITDKPERELKTHKLTKLWYKQAGSDKVYNVYLRDATKSVGLLDVAVEYGRRGTALTPLVKMTDVDMVKGEKFFDKLVRTQTSKGYSIIRAEEGATVSTPNAVLATIPAELEGPRLLPQLLNPIDDQQLEIIFKDNDYWAQEKMDGKRIILSISSKRVVGLNRKGTACSIHEDIEKDAKPCFRTFGKVTFDGEMVGNIYYIFDCIRVDKEDIRVKPYHERYDVATKAVNSLPKDNKHLQLVPCVMNETDKRNLFNTIKDHNGEGIVFKKRDAVYTPGRPNSLGDQLKYKFTETASVVVTRVNERRSVAICVMDGHKPVSVGNVSIPPNKPIPNVGDVVEVEYLYAFEGGSLFQPVYLNLRDDLTSLDCQKAKLKFKPQSENDDSDA